VIASCSEDFEIRICEALARLLRCEPARVRPEAALMGDLKVDSLEFLTLIVGLERAFEVELPDVEAARFRTVGDVIVALKKYSGCVAEMSADALLSAPA
jgi:acyl carrier protein